MRGGPFKKKMLYLLGRMVADSLNVLIFLLKVGYVGIKLYLYETFLPLMDFSRYAIIGMLD